MAAPKSLRNSREASSSCLKSLLFLMRSYCRLALWILFSVFCLLQWQFWISPRQEPTSLRLSNWQQQQQQHSTAPPKFHLVFSTGCNAFQDWQSYVFFYQIWQSGQTGNVTRIASGCRPEEKALLHQYFLEQIQEGIPTGIDRFHLHVTPDYSKTALPGVNFKFFNKPFGLLHWMENALQMPQSLPEYADTVFIVLDPDQYILRPFDSRNFAAAPQQAWPWHNRRPRSDPFSSFQTSNNNLDVVREGNPMAQLYLFGSNWWPKVQKDLDRVVSAAAAVQQQNPAFAELRRTGAAASPLTTATTTDVERSFVAGPPYVALGPDLYRIVALWAAVVVPVYQLTDGDHLAEMYGYSVAAMHLQLPHQLSVNFMISHPPIVHQEGWAALDAMNATQVCDAEAVARTAHLPHVVHYCQRYYLGPYFFSKYRLPWDFLSCAHPLLLDPRDEEGDAARTLAWRYNTSTTPDGTFYALPPWERPRQAFFLCHMIGTLNEAATYWKQQHCDPNVTTVNLEKSFFVPPDRPPDPKE